MIPVPRPVLEALALRYRAAPDTLAHFGGGRPESDGIVYAYPSGEGRRMLKVIAIPLEGASRAMRCFDERLRFTHYLGTHGARIAHPLPSPAGNLYETSEHGAHRWVAYAMDVAPGTVVRPDAWIPALFRDWGRTIGLLHRLARAYPPGTGPSIPETGRSTSPGARSGRAFIPAAPTAPSARRGRQSGSASSAAGRARCIRYDPQRSAPLNLLYDARAGVTLLDFDVANHHWFINDIAIATQTILFAQSGGLDRPLERPEKLRGFLALFMEGYRREHDLDPRGWTASTCSSPIAAFSCTSRCTMISAADMRSVRWRGMILSARGRRPLGVA